MWYLLFFCLSLFISLYSAPPKLWIENDTTEFQDGYFFRSTITPAGFLEIHPLQDWFDHNWMYRTPIRIINTTFTFTDYQLKLTINTKALVDAGKLRRDGGDLRFVDPKNNKVYPFWVYPDTSSIALSNATIIYVKIDKIPALSEKFIYLYYGNPSTTTVINGKDVFLVYEDFETGIPSPPTWTGIDYSSYVITTSSRYQGGYSLAILGAGHSTNSGIRLNRLIDTNIEISFYWAVSSEYGGMGWAGTERGDGLLFRVYRDDNLVTFPAVAQIKQEVPWSKRSHRYGPGSYKFDWYYAKDGSLSLGADRGWVDLIFIRKIYTHPANIFLEYTPSVSFLPEERRTNYYVEGKYWSNILDTKTDNTVVGYVSWTVVNPNPLTYVKQYIRASNVYFANPTGGAFTFMPNPGVYSAIKGRYIQYYIEFISTGAYTPTFKEMYIEYKPPPTPPTNFHGVVVSSDSIRWSWKDNAHIDTVPEDGFKLYVQPGNFVIDLPANTTEYIQRGLSPNTLYTSSVAAYNVYGANFSNLHSVYTYALQPMTSSYFYDPAKDTTTYWQTEVYYTKPEIKFTNEYSTGPGKAAFFYLMWTTSDTYTFTGKEPKWFLRPPGNDPRPVTTLRFTKNSKNWYLHLMSVNDAGVGYYTQKIGPFYFSGCPSKITTLEAKPDTEYEGAIRLTWTAPYGDAESGSFTGNYIIKYTTREILTTDERFDRAEHTLTIRAENVLPGTIQMIAITRLIPGKVYYFAIKSLDEDKNLSELSNSTFTIAAKIHRFEFYTPTQTIRVGDYSAPIVVRSLDVMGNPLKAAKNITVIFKTNSPRGEFATEKPDEEPSWGRTFTTLYKGKNSFIFYYRDKSAGEFTISVSAPPEENIQPGQQKITFLPGPAVKFLIQHDGVGTIGVDEFVTIAAADRYDNISTTYTGTVNIVSLDPVMSVIPSFHQFTLADQGKITVKAINFRYAVDVPINVNDGVISSTSTPIRWTGVIFSTQTTTYPQKLPIEYLRQGRTDEPILLLKLRPRLKDENNPNTNRISSIKFSLTGDLSPEHISQVKIYNATYREIGEVREYIIHGSTIGSASFVGSTVTVPLQGFGVSLTTKYLLLTADISYTAPVGAKFKFTFNKDTLELVNPVPPLAWDGLPYTTPEFEIIPATCSVRLTVDTSLAPEAISPGDEKIFAELSMITDLGRTDFRALTIENTQAPNRPPYYNPLRDAEIIRIYKDRDANKRIDLEVDLLMGVATFYSDVVTINFPDLPKYKEEREIDFRTTHFYLLTVKIPEDAEPRRLNPPTISLLLRATTPYFLLDPKGLNSISSVKRNYETRISTIMPIIDIVKPSVLHDPTRARNVLQGRLEPFQKIKLKSESPRLERPPLAKINKLIFKSTGTVDVKDINSIILFEETVTLQNYVFHGITYHIPGVLISSGTFSPATLAAEVTIPERKITDKQPVTYLVYLLFDRLAGVGKTVKIELIDIRALDPDEYDKTIIPSAMNTIVDFPDEITVSLHNPKMLTDRKSKRENISWVYQDEENVNVSKLNIITFSSATFTAITLRHGHEWTNLQAREAVKTIRIYLDANNNGRYDPSDLEIGRGSFTYVDVGAAFSSGTITLSPQTITYLTPKTYFIVYDFFDVEKIGYILDFGTAESYLKFTVLSPDIGATLRNPPEGLLSIRIKNKREPIVSDIRPKVPVPEGIIINGEKVYYSGVADNITFFISSYVVLPGQFKYKYAIGRTPDRADVLTWRESTSPNVSAFGLNLQHNTTYFLLSKVLNYVDNRWFESEPAYQIIKIDLTPPKKPKPPTHTLNPYSMAVNDSFWINFEPTIDDELTPIVCYELQERTNESPEWITLDNNISPNKREYFISNRKPGVYYYYRIRAKNAAGLWSEYSDCSASAITARPQELISNISNYPNPFDARLEKTHIVFTLREKANVSVKIFDLFGNIVIEMPTREFDPNDAVAEEIIWDGKNEMNKNVSTGVYIAVIEAKTRDEFKKSKIKIAVIH